VDSSTDRPSSVQVGDVNLSTPREPTRGRVLCALLLSPLAVVPAAVLILGTSGIIDQGPGALTESLRFISATIYFGVPIAYGVTLTYGAFMHWILTRFGLLSFVNFLLAGFLPFVLLGLLFLKDSSSLYVLLTTTAYLAAYGVSVASLYWYILVGRVKRLALTRRSTQTRAKAACAG
jgi:hypothetical protein